jgi:hypothetical protein
MTKYISESDKCPGKQQSSVRGRNWAVHQGGRVTSLGVIFTWDLMKLGLRFYNLSSIIQPAQGIPLKACALNSEMWSLKTRLFIPRLILESLILTVVHFCTIKEVEGLPYWRYLTSD